MRGRCDGDSMRARCDEGETRDDADSDSFRGFGLDSETNEDGRRLKPEPWRCEACTGKTHRYARESFNYVYSCECL